MKKIKLFLSISIMVAFIVLPFIANVFYEDEEKGAEVKKVVKTKNITQKEKETPKKVKKSIKKEDKPPKKQKEKSKKKKKNIKKKDKSVKKTKEKVKKKVAKPVSNNKIKTKSIKKVKKIKKVDKKINYNKYAFHLSNYERRVVECIVMGESGSESYYGKLLVAFCIRNACEKDGLQPSQVRKAYKYSGWNSNPTQSVKNAVSEIFDKGRRPINDTPLYFYAPKRCDSAWHESQRYICTVGGHRFFGRK